MAEARCVCCKPGRPRCRRHPPPNEATEAVVDLIAKTQAQTHGVADAWASFIPEAREIVDALLAARVLAA